jgi:cell cycle sensor histidine kinase DivJ
MGVCLGAALLLIVEGSASLALLGGLALGALPGLIGWIVRPRQGHGAILLVVWAIASAFAMAMTGGVSGPLGMWAAAPLLASVALGGLWRDGATMSFAAFTGVAMIQAAGQAGPMPTGLDSLFAGLIASGVALAGGAAALMIQGPRRTAPLPPAPDPRAAVPPPRPPGQTGLELEARRNLEARKALEARLAEAEAARVEAQTDARGKMRFLANMSHELRTPLNAIMGFSDIMRSRLFGDLPSRYADYPELIHEAGRHLLDLINDVLDMSKIEADKFELHVEDFDVREPVNAALRILQIQAHEAGVNLRGVLPSEPLDVRADRRAIKQMVLNLVSNAVKFTPPPGSVTVTVQAVEGVLELTVADTGVGIAPEDLVRLGRPYEQAGDSAARAGGTGLGLSLVKAFAGLHQGDMTMESRLGEGTAVTLRLPVLVPAETAAGTGA